MEATRLERIERLVLGERVVGDRAPPPRPLAKGIRWQCPCGVQQRVLVLAEALLAMASSACHHLDVCARDVAGGEQLGGAIVRAGQPGRADQARRVGVRHRRPVGEPGLQRPRALLGPCPGRVPLAETAQRLGFQALSCLQQLQEPGRAGGRRPAAAVLGSQLGQLRIEHTFDHTNLAQLVKERLRRI